MEYPVWVEVDLDALRHNVEVARRDLGAGVRLLFVVKADAYGHGAREVCRFAQHLAVDMFGVATLHDTNGRWDLLAELRAQSLQELAKVLERIRLLKGISNTETSIHLETFRLS